jgi:hypothetical protein
MQQELLTGMFFDLTARRPLRVTETVSVKTETFSAKNETFLAGIRGGSCNPSYWEVGI